MKHFISSLSVLCANTPPCEGRVSSRKILSLLLILFLSIGNAWGAEEELYKTVLFGSSYNSKGVSGYNNVEFTSTNEDFTVVVKNANNNGNQWNVIKIGGKNGAYTGTITTQESINRLITKVDLTIDGITSSSVTSIELYSSSNGTNWTKVGDFNKAQGISSVEISSPTTDLYYQLKAVCTKGSSNGLITISKVEFYAEKDASAPTLSSIAISGDLTNKTYEEGQELDLTGLTVTGTYSDASTQDVTADVEWSYDPLTKGQTSVTVTATYEEQTADKTITGLTVNEHVVTPGEYTIALNNVFFGTTAGTGIPSFPLSAKQDDITVTLNGSGTKTRTDAANVRMYTGNTLTFSVPSGYVIKSIVFAEPTSSKTWDGKISVATGTYTEDAKSWAGNAQEVVFSFGAQNRIATATITYAADVKYTLNITTPANGTLVVKEGETELANGAQVSAGTSLTVIPTPAEGYVFESLTVGGEAVELTDGTYTFNMPAANVTIVATFKANEKPDATLTLSDIEGTTTQTGALNGTITLPTTAAECSKTFVGWDADENCDHAPTYAPGAEYTFTTLDPTLYAVYADGEGGGTVTITPSKGTEETKACTFNLDQDGYTLSASGGGSSPVYNETNSDARIYAGGILTLTATKAMNTIVIKLSAQGKKRLAPITVSTGTIATQAVNDATVTWTGNATEVVFTVGDKANFGSDGETKAGQLCFSTIEVTHSSEYSNYSTTCAAALANPTFSLTEGKYTEAKSVEITATEGTVYYTIDGTTPTASSTQYTGAIALNDCGEYTIKAIAISADSQSDVVSATYTIKLPLTNSQAAPYTEAEAIAVYDGGCYDNQDVYVKGTVKTATFNSTYGNYTITLTNGFQFYRFLQAAETKFTEDIIVPGDVLVACGKLSKYNTTYQLAEGCYLVERIPYEGEKTDISNTEATAYTVDQAFALIADVSSDLTKEVYVKGLVAVAPTSNPTADGQMTYKISDNGENTGNVLTVYLGLNLNGEKFTSKNDVQQGDYVVVKGKLLDYNSTYELNKGNQLVQHVKAATITISDITMEVGETKTIAATITPDAAKTEVTYSIKAGSDDCITLSENNITAKAEGTATIVATIATAEGEYMGKTVEFEVTVTPKSTKEKVVILAQYEGKWYAMKAQYVTGKTSHLAPLSVTYFDGKLYNVSEEDKALIEWECAVVDGKATFYNDGKYLTGKSGDTDLTLAATACEWTISGDSYLIDARTFLYNAENNWFRNFGTGNAGNKNYSDMPTVTAPVYATGDIVYTRDVTPGNYGTICLPYASDNFTGATFFEVAGKEGDKVFFDEVTTLEAGKPYIFMAEETEIKVTQIGESAVEAGKSNSLQGTFTQIAPAVDNVLVGNYMVVNNVIKKCGANCGLKAYRAYFIAGELESLGTPFAPVPGRRRVAIGQAPQVATGVDQVQGDNVPTKMIINGQLFILRGEKMYDAQGKLVK